MEGQAQSAPVSKKSSAAKTYTLEEYFDFEYKAEGKHEYLDGRIRALAYTSPAHGEIQTNLMDALAACLKAKACKRYAADRMIYVPDCNKVFYPDFGHRLWRTGISAAQGQNEGHAQSLCHHRNPFRQD